MTSEVRKWHVKWLFSILDYQHFTLLADDVEVGHLVANPVDRTIALRSFDDGSVLELPAEMNSYGRFERWYRFHRSL